MKDPYLSFRRQSASYLAQFANHAENAIPQLLQALEDKDFPVRSGIYQTLGNLGPKAKSTIPVLIKSLSRSESGDKKAAANALVGMGVAAFPALVELLEGKDDDLRITAANIIEKMSDKGVTDLALLTKYLKDPNKKVRNRMAWSLLRLGTRAEKAIPALAIALGAADDYTRSCSRRALVKQGVKAVPALAKALQSPQPIVRQNALLALGELGPLAKGAVPDLVVILSDNTSYLRIRAAMTLGKIGPSAKAAEPALIEATKQSDKELKLEAFKALDKIRGK